MLIDRLAASLAAAKPYATITAASRRRFGRHARRARAHPAGDRRGAAQPGAAPDARRRLGRGERRALLAADRRVPRAASASCTTRSARDYPWSGTAPDLEQVGARARALHALEKNRPVIVVASARALLRTVPPQGSHVFDPLVLEAGLHHRPRRGTPRASRAWATSASRSPRAPGSSRCAAACSTSSRAGSSSPGARRAVRRRDRDAASATCPRPARRSATPSPSRSSPAGSSASARAASSTRRRRCGDKALKDPFARAPARAARAGRLLQRHRGATCRCSTSVPACPPTTSAPTSLDRGRRAALALRRRRPPPRRARPRSPQAAARTPLDGLYLAPGRARLRRAPAAHAAVDPPRRRAASTPSSPRADPRSRAARSASSAAFARCSRPATRSRSPCPTAAPAAASPTCSSRPASRIEAERDHGAARRRRRRPRRTRRWRKGVVDVADTDVPAGFVIADAKLAVVSIDDVYPRSRGPPRAPPDRPHQGHLRLRARRLRRARHARHRAVQGDRAPGGSRPGARLPAARVRQGRQALRAGRADRPRHQVRRPRRQRRRASRASTPPTGPRDRQGAQGRARSSRSTSSTSTRAARPSTGYAYRRGHAVAARDGGGVPVRGDARPARGHRRREGRHGVRQADGPPDLRRRRLRQDRGRHPRGVQGHPGRQAGHGAVPDDDPRAAALHHLLRALRAVPGPVEVLSRFRTEAQQKAALEGFARGEVDVLVGTHRLLSRDVDARRPRPRHHRRGAALRRRAQGAHQEPARAGRRARPSRRRRSRARCRCRCRACAT